jgi:predicted nucleic acid-binding protein
VLDTNVLVAALRSSSGASHQILMAADRGDFEVALSVPLLAEYDDVLVRPSSGFFIPRHAVEAIIGRIAQISPSSRFISSGVRYSLIPRMTWSWNWQSPPALPTS